MAETHQAMLLARLRAGLMGASLSGEESESLFSARQSLELATIGGAAVLGRNDIGSLEVGKCADFIAINLNRLEFTGALHDPLAAVLFCQPVNVDLNVVHGEVIVRNQQMVNVDLPKLIRDHNQAAARLLTD
jgi:cytosine/adenosine deaminase-related metal-dependent hydrolase